MKLQRLLMLMGEGGGSYWHYKGALLPLKSHRYVSMYSTFIYFFANKIEQNLNKMTNLFSVERSLMHAVWPQYMAYVSGVFSLISRGLGSTPSSNNTCTQSSLPAAAAQWSGVLTQKQKSCCVIIKNMGVLGSWLRMWHHYDKHTQELQLLPISNVL